jgi:hypothetical protein
MPELVDIGAAKRDEKTNELLVQAKTEQIGATPDDAPGLDAAPVFGQLGIAAIPWPADERGNAQGIKEDAPGHNGIITGMRDARAAGIVEELGPGETCIHSTGPDFDTRLFLKKQLWSLMIGDDCAVTMDRENERFTIACFGHIFEMSAANGCVLTTGGATLQLKDAVANLLGQVVLGGRSPFSQVLFTDKPGTPVVGTGPAGGVPALGVFIGV